MSLKRILLFILPLALVVGVVLYYPVTKTSAISIPLPVERAVHLLADPTYIKKWYQPFTDANTDTSHQSDKQWQLTNGDLQLSLRNKNTISATLLLTEKNQEAAFFYHTTLDSNYIDQTKVTMTYKKNWLGNFNGRNKLIDLAETSLQSLATYASNTVRLYGLEIRHKDVTDSAYLFTQKTTSWAEVKTTVQSLYKDLVNFADANKIDKNGAKIINIKILSGDSIRVSAGLAIQQYINLPLNGKITYRTMPYGKKLLEAPFKGRYADLPQAFQSLDQYARDHKLTNMAIAYGKFSDDRTDYEQGDIIDMMVYYPVD